MRKYDTTFIISGALDRDRREAVIAKYVSALEGFGGAVDRVVRWGMRDLAYSIKKQKHGYYVICYYDAEPEIIKSFEGELRLDENILRYMTILFDGSHPDYIRDETSVEERTREASPVAQPVEKPAEVEVTDDEDAAGSEEEADVADDTAADEDDAEDVDTADEDVQDKEKE